MRKVPRKNTEPEAANVAVLDSPPVEVGQHEPVEEPGFWDLIQGLTDSEWQYHTVYLYRLEPAIVNSGDKNFIEKRRTPFDEDAILTTHGSGRYLAILNNTRARKTVAKLSFACYRADMPPKIRLAQLASTAEDSWRVWLAEVEAKQQAAANTPSGDESTAELTRLLGRVIEQGQQSKVPDANTRKITDTLTDWALKQVSQDRESSKTAAVVVDPLAMLKETLTTFKEMQKTFTPPPRSEPESKTPVEQVREMAETVKTLREAFGPTVDDTPTVATEGGSIWKTLVTSLAPVIGQLAAPIGNALAARLFMTPGSVNPVVPMQPPSPSAVTNANQSPVLPSSEIDPAVQFQISQIVGQIGPMLINALNQGLTGEDFAQSIYNLFGGIVFEQIAAYRRDDILVALMSHPQLGNQLRPILPKLEVFIDEFLTYGTETEEDDDAQASVPA